MNPLSRPGAANRPSAASSGGSGIALPAARLTSTTRPAASRLRRLFVAFSHSRKVRVWPIKPGRLETVIPSRPFGGSEFIVPLPYNQRTHDCGALRGADVGKTVLLSGWVDNFRDHGGMVFIDLRDRGGMTQLRFNPDTDPAAHTVARALRSEYVICVRGEVVSRGSNVNPKMPT